MSRAIRQKLIAITVVTGFVLVFVTLLAIVFNAPLDSAIIIGLMMGFTTGSIEEFYVQGRAGIWMRRMRPTIAIPIYAAALCVIFLAVQHFAFFVTGRADELGAAYARYPVSIPALFVASALAVLALRVVGFMGAKNLFNLLIGRYMRPIVERKVMLFLDLKGSTASVEKLGAMRGKAYIGKFLFDISRPVTDHGGDIYLYTGDGLIAIWEWDEAMAGNTILAAIRAIHDAVAQESEGYEREFGMVPQFRIGVHGGDVVISEQGDTKRAIGVYGDAINIAARMEQTAKEIGVDIVLSADLVESFPVAPSGVAPQGKVKVRGISKQIEVYSYSVE